MRVGRDDNFLLIECNPMRDGYATCRIEAVRSDSHSRLTAMHDCWLLLGSPEIVQRFTDFAEFRTNEVEILLAQVSLRLSRDARGYITVYYRIKGWEMPAAMEGEVTVEGEHAGGFCRDFAALFYDRTRKV